MKILYCFLYLAGTGILGFLLGRIVPKRWFCADRFPFRVRPWEQKLYQALRVKQWQNKVPDMSRLLGDMVKKQLAPDGKTDYALLVQETCVAECVHFCLGLLSLGAFALCRSGWMVCIVAVYILLGNLPFQIIQRYNRPRLLRLMRKARKAK